MTNKVVVGERYGRQTVIADAGMTRSGRRVRCRCECGKESVRYLSGLKSGTEASCRCSRSARRVEPGERFGRWLVVRDDKDDEYESASFQRVWCRCDCGTERSVIAESLSRGRSTSCGCYHREVAGLHSKRHGQNNSGMYHVWWSMHRRCYDPKHKAFKQYGGKGVRVCERWHDISNFVADMGSRPAGTTIDRLDASKDYEPGNCRWATGKQQIRHRSNTYTVEYNGEKIALGDLLDLKGVGLRVVNGSRDHRIYARAYSRHRAGWSLDAVVAAAAKEKGGSA